MRTARQSLVEHPQRSSPCRRVTPLGSAQEQRGRNRGRWEHRAAVATNNSTAAELRAGLRHQRSSRRVTVEPTLTDHKRWKQLLRRTHRRDVLPATCRAIAGAAVQHTPSEVTEMLRALVLAGGRRPRPVLCVVGRHAAAGGGNSMAVATQGLEAYAVTGTPPVGRERDPLRGGFAAAGPCSADGLSYLIQDKVVAGFRQPHFSPSEPTRVPSDPLPGALGRREGIHRHVHRTGVN